MSNNIHSTISKIINIMRFYFFKSTNKKDYVSGISIFTTTSKRATILARNYFVKLGCKGEPAMMAI